MDVVEDKCMGKISKKELKLIQRQHAAYDCYAYDLPLKVKK